MRTSLLGVPLKTMRIILSLLVFAIVKGHRGLRGPSKDVILEQRVACKVSHLNLNHVMWNVVRKSLGWDKDPSTMDRPCVDFPASGSRSGGGSKR